MLSKSNYRKYVDKYFIRSREILEKELLNPLITMQVFVRKPGRVGGIAEAVDLINQLSDLKRNGGSIYALDDGEAFADCETLMLIEGFAQDFIELETLYLGVISRETTLASNGPRVDYKDVFDTMRAITLFAGDRPVYYFGARHWHYSEDHIIGGVCIEAGAKGCSTDIGSQTIEKEGIGTIPHALILIMGSTIRAAKAFNFHMHKAVPRIALVDTFNRELTDTRELIKGMGEQIQGVRIDTCGENVGEGVYPHDMKQYNDRCYYVTGKGVTCEGAYQMRKTLLDAGREDMTITLSSGFGPKKTQIFTMQEEELGVRLFDSIGTGSVFPTGSMFATADIVMIDKVPVSKVGRSFRPNKRLRRML